MPPATWQVLSEAGAFVSALTISMARLAAAFSGLQITTRMPG